MGRPEKDDAKQALENSLVVFAARVNGKLAGSVRIIEITNCAFIYRISWYSAREKAGIATKLIQTEMHILADMQLIMHTLV